MALLLKQITGIFLLLLVFCTSAKAATTWCADPVNGSDSNSGVASGTVPNLTNCVQSIEKACTLLTTGDTLETTNVFHDPTLADATTDMCLIPSTAANVTWLSYGPVLKSDRMSDMSVSSILDGGDCLGRLRGECATATNAISTWTNVSGSIFKTGEQQFTHFVYFDGVQGWPDQNGGLKAAGCVGPGACPDSVTNPSQLPLWQSSHTYAANSDVQNGVYPAEWWHTTAGGTSSTTAPTCTGHACQAGTTTFGDGSVTWIFEGPAAATIGPMVAGSWYWDGQSIFVWTPDSTNPNLHVVSADVKLYPIHVNATTGNNGLKIQHVGMRHTGAGPLYFDTSGSGNCFANMDFEYNYIYQTGESNVDVAQFLNGFRYSGGDATCNPAPIIRHNYVAFTGDHGGGITVQVGGNGDISMNNIEASNHAGVNLTQNGVVNPCPNCTIMGNYVHNQVISQNAPVVSDSAAGIYAQNATGLKIGGNYVTGVLSASCGGAQCMGISLFAGSNNTIVNNTVDSVQQAIEEISAGSGLVIKNNICNNLVTESGTASCIVLQATADASQINENILSSITNVAIVGGVNKNFSQWQAFGFDAQGFNSNATFWRQTAPFFLAPGSIGIGTADASQGFGFNIGSNQMLIPGMYPLTWAPTGPSALGN